MSESFREQLEMLVDGVRKLSARGCLECPLNLYPGCGAMLHWTTFDVDALIASVPECAQLQTNEMFKSELAALAKDANKMCNQVGYKSCTQCALHTGVRCGGGLCYACDIDTILAAIAEWRKRKDPTAEGINFQEV